MTNDHVEAAYGSASIDAAGLLGSLVSADDPDRTVIEPWAETISGPILDVGSGTGRWTGHLANLGYPIEGLEPADRLVALAEQQYPSVSFHRGSIADLAATDRRWTGMLAWYSLIHMGPDELSTALTTLRTALDDDGSMLLSFFSGPQLETFDHPVTTAYRWPLPEMTQALADTGFTVAHQHWDQRAPHAYMIARAAA